MTSRIFKLAYQLRLHRVGGWALDRWAVTLVWGASVLIGLQWLLRGEPILPAWHWAVLALLILGGMGLVFLRVWAARRSYVTFDPQPGLKGPPAAPMSPDDKISLQATGAFEVQGRVRTFVGLLAYWRSYASREHTVMAIQHQNRFFLGRSPAEDVGMWYMFISAAAVAEVIPGQLHFGFEIGPALRVSYRRQPPASEGKRPHKAVNAMVYLAFEDEATRGRVWADLAADVGVVLRDE